MLGIRQALIGLTTFAVGLSVCPSAARADETPEAIHRVAIKAHGGKEKLATTLTGKLLARGTFAFGPDVEGSLAWEETFELPRRYRRAITGRVKDMVFRMEYAATDGSGWIRQDGGEPRDFKGAKQPLHRSWNATLALLPACPGDGVKLAPGGTEKVGGREALGVKVEGDSAGGEAVLFFDARTGLLAKSRRRMQHPLSGEEVDGEVVYGDYKEVAGVQYPHRITSYVGGKKAFEVEITRLELLQKLDDRLFEKPK